MGLVPHSAAKDASLRIRSGLSPAATSSVEATSTPTPRAASSAGLVASHRASRSASSRAISAVSAWWRRARQRRAVLAATVAVSPCVSGPQPGAGLDCSGCVQSPQAVFEVLGGGDGEPVDLVGGDGAGLDG